MNGFQKISLPLQTSTFYFMITLCLHPLLMAQNTITEVSFTKNIAPILAAKCQGCHNDKKSSMGFNLTTFNKMKQGGKQTGPDEMIVPGKPEESRFVEVVLDDAQPRMPFKLKSLSQDEITLIRNWVAQGAINDSPTPDTPLTEIAPPEKVLASEKFQKSNELATKPSVSISADSKWVALGENSMISIYEINKNGLPIKSIGPVNGQIQSLWISPEKDFLIVASSRQGLEGILSRWDLKSGRMTYQAKVHDDQILSMAVNAETSQIATGSYDKSVAITNMADGNLISRLSEHTDAVYSVAFGPKDTSILVSASGDRTVKVWDHKTKKRIETFSDSTAELYSVAVSSDGKSVYAGGVDRTLRAWNISDGPRKIFASALAHEGPITHLQFISSGNIDSSELVSMSEDKSVRRWNPAQLKPIGEPLKFNDWVISQSANKTHFGLSLYDGFVRVYQWGNQPQLVWQRPAGQMKGGTPDSFKPQLFRFSNLGAPSPRFVVAGKESTITLTGSGVEDPLKIWAEPGDIKFEVEKPSNPTPNTLKLKLSIPERNTFDSARIRVATKSGITGDQTIGIIPKAWKSLESGKSPETFDRDSIFQATIYTPASKFSTLIKARKSQTVSLNLYAKRAGSSLTPRIQFKSESGKVLAEKIVNDNSDPIITYQSPIDQQITMELTDSQFTAGGNHFAFMHLSDSMVATSQFPLAVKSGMDHSSVWLDAHGVKAEVQSPQVSTDISGLKTVSVAPPPGWISNKSFSQIILDGNVYDHSDQDQVLSSPSAISARFESPYQSHSYKFHAKKGQPLVIETYARRLGRATDTLIEIKDKDGMTVNFATFRKVADTLIAFRDHGSRQKGIRLTQWADFAMADYVLIGREITRIFQLPKNPDDDCQFFGDEFRWGYFGTTPEQHSMGQTVTKIEAISASTARSIDPNLLYHAAYINDDGGATVGNDSFLLFDAPQDGTYQVVVRETSGASGPESSYALVIRNPSPDYSIQLSPLDWSIPTNGSKLVTASIRRIDGFNGPVQLQFSNLPPGWKSTSGEIESGQLSCDLLIEPDSGQTPGLFGDSKWVLNATSEINGKKQTKTINGIGHGWVITSESNLSMTTSTSKLAIEPGKVSTMKLKVDRREPFSGRVPIDVRNLPYGVRVLDIGLNGVLITESQTEREIRIYCEPWVEPQQRPFFAVGRAESAGTADSSPSVILEIKPALKSDQIQQARAK